jgi:hypothetical protein
MKRFGWIRAFAEWVARLPLMPLTTQPQRQCIVPCAFSLSPSLLNNWWLVQDVDDARAERGHLKVDAGGGEDKGHK